jgi:SAM-dependent MidA family methyltransferase
MHDSKMMWKTLNEIINRKTKKNEISNEFIDSNSIDLIINQRKSPINSTTTLLTSDPT